MIFHNPLGLAFSFSATGELQSIAAAPIRISLRPASLFGLSSANLYLRKRSGQVSSYTALLGVESPSRYRLADGIFEAHGHQ